MWLPTILCLRFSCRTNVCYFWYYRVKSAFLDYFPYSSNGQSKFNIDCIASYDENQKQNLAYVCLGDCDLRAFLAFLLNSIIAFFMNRSQHIMFCINLSVSDFKKNVAQLCTDESDILP